MKLRSGPVVQASAWGMKPSLLKMLCLTTVTSILAGHQDAAAADGAAHPGGARVPHDRRPPAPRQPAHRAAATQSRPGVCRRHRQGLDRVCGRCAQTVNANHMAALETTKVTTIRCPCSCSCCTQHGLLLCLQKDVCRKINSPRRTYLTDMMVDSQTYPWSCSSCGTAWPSLRAARRWSSPSPCRRCSRRACGACCGRRCRRGARTPRRRPSPGPTALM